MLGEAQRAVLKPPAEAEWLSSLGANQPPAPTDTCSSRSLRFPFAYPETRRDPAPRNPGEGGEGLTLPPGRGLERATVAMAG